MWFVWDVVITIYWLCVSEHIIEKEYLIFYYLVSSCVICHGWYSEFVNIFKINKIKNTVIFNNIFKHKKWTELIKNFKIKIIYVFKKWFIFLK